MVPGDKRRNLLKEVKEECKDLSCLSADLRGTFLRGFVAIMKKNELLYELESQVQIVLCWRHTTPLPCGFYSF